MNSKKRFCECQNQGVGEIQNFCFIRKVIADLFKELQNG